MAQAMLAYVLRLCVMCLRLIGKIIFDGILIDRNTVLNQVFDVFPEESNLVFVLPFKLIFSFNLHFLLYLKKKKETILLCIVVHFGILFLKSSSLL